MLALPLSDRGVRGTAQKCLSWLRSDRSGQSKKRITKRKCVWSGVANVTFSIYSSSSFSLLTNALASLTQKRSRCDTGVSR